MRFSAEDPGVPDSFFRTATWKVGALAALAFGAGTAAGGEPSRVAVGRGTFMPPQGEWQQKVAAAGYGIQFQRVQQSTGVGLFITARRGVQTIVVFQTAVAPEKVLGGPAVVAADYFANEERIMLEEGVAAGDYELKDQSRGSATIGDKSLHAYSYRKDLSINRFGAKRERATLYLWFPPDFTTTREFYGFLVSQLWQYDPVFDRKSGGAEDARYGPELIWPVIEGFRLEPAAQTP